jgi:uncharacterized protein (TIRG00374 family)
MQIYMDGKQKNLLYFGVSTLIIILLIYFADADKFIESVRTARKFPLAAGILSGIVAFSILGYTWHRFLNKIDLKTSYLQSFRLFMAGQFMNSVTPLGQLGGEPVMAYIISDTEDTEYEKALSAVVSADIINTIPYITFMLGGAAYLILFDTINSTLAQTASITFVITIIGGLIAYTLWFRAYIIKKVIMSVAVKIAEISGRGDHLLEPLEERINHLKETFESIGEEPAHLASTAAVAHIFFLLQVIALYFVIASIGKTVPISSLYFVIAVSSLANFSPTPGGSGTYEAAMAGVLIAFTPFSFAQALTVSILYRIATYWNGLIIGYIALVSLRRGKSLDTEDISEEVSEKED